MIPPLLLYFSHSKHYGTGAPFFGWKKHSEGRKILVHGPFEFRIRENEPEDDVRTLYMVNLSKLRRGSSFFQPLWMEKVFNEHNESLSTLNKLKTGLALGIAVLAAGLVFRYISSQEVDS